jgi:hypothetical protein
MINVTKVQLTLDYTSLLLTFELGAATMSDRYILKKIDGLDPPQLNIYLSQMRNLMNIYQGDSAENREVILTFELNPDYSVSESVAELRQALYAFMTPTLPSQHRVVLSLFDQTISDSIPQLQTFGYIKRIAANPFASDAEVQVTMVCLSPYLDGPQIEPDREAGQADWWYGFENLGNAPAQFETRITFTQTSAYPYNKLQLGNCFDPPYMNLDYTFYSGDVLHINTYSGSRTISVSHDTNPAASILYALTGPSTWFELRGQGATALEFVATSAQITYVAYTPRYWGI